MRKLCLTFCLLAGCGGPLSTPKIVVEQTKSDANIIVAVAASIKDNTDKTIFEVGECPECNGSGRTGDGIGACGPCRGDGQISKEDADIANNMSTEEPQVEEPQVTEIEFEKPIEFISLREARDKSIQEGLPVWIHFSKTKDCQVCALLKKVVFPDPKVCEASKQFACVTIDCGDADNPDPNITKILADFRIDRREGLPQDLFLLPGWRQIAKPFKSRPPITAQGYAAYLDKWAEYLTKR